MKAMLAAMVLITLLAGCTGGQKAGTNQEPTKQPEASAAATEPADKLEEMKITVLARSMDVMMPNASDDFIKQAIKEKFNVELEVEPVLDAQLSQKAGAYFASGDFPDVVAFRGFEEEFVRQGLMLPLDDYLDQLPNYTKNWPASDRAQWTFSEDGKIYGIPEIKLNVMNTLWIRKDWLDALGLPVPSTMQELADAGEAFAKQDPDKNGIADTFSYFIAGDGGNGVGGVATFQRFLGTQFNQPFLKQDGTVEFSQFSDANARSLKFLKEQLIDRSIDPNWFLLKGADQANKLNAGQIGIVASNVSFYNQTSSSSSAESPIPGEWIPLPDITDEGKALNYNFVGFPFRTFFLTKDVAPEKADRFMEILEWMATPGEGYELITYGREGIEYEKKGDAVVQLVNPSDTGQLWRDNYRWFYDDRDPFWLAGLTEELLAINAKMIDRFNAPNYDLRSLSYLQDFSQNSYSNYNIADFNRFYNEALFEFLLGKRSFDKWEDFKKEGIEKFHFQEFMDWNETRFKEKLNL
ncbi:extracellular solute-binding protein [Paenibacillus agaridevorans]|uniref:extracellular solute-binding protein n=1 Tax=Paenibacillus agaridevorans TaxID=171404 RepID=UPI001BE44D2F|nr:extracellular solute-binding protein [Paenibacillus agaridevorans]